MFRVISTLIVHRPERLLYYLPDMTPEIENCIAEGTCPDALKKYQYAFGSYDDVGVFYLSEFLQIKTGFKRVVGIEFRKDDAAVQLPDNLPCIELPDNDMIIQDVAYEYQMNDELLEEIVHSAKNEKNDRTGNYRYLEGGMSAAFAVKG